MKQHEKDENPKNIKWDIFTFTRKAKDPQPPSPMFSLNRSEFIPVILSSLNKIAMNDTWSRIRADQTPQHKHTLELHWELLVPKFYTKIGWHCIIICIMYSIQASQNTNKWTFTFSWFLISWPSSWILWKLHFHPSLKIWERKQHLDRSDCFLGATSDVIWFLVSTIHYIKWDLWRE